MSNQPEESYQKSGYALSSWNYGSFHHCNPYYQKREFLKENNKNQKNQHLRSQSANLNKFGKRILKDEEKIVTEDYMINMKNYKMMKNNNKELNKNKSSANVTKSKILVTNETPNKSNLNNTSHNSSFRNSNKQFKFQLSFDEWAAVKSKQQEIFKKVKIIKESEDQNFEIFNRKIDDNYKVVQEQNFNEWTQKKELERQRQNQMKMNQEESKIMKKENKKNENSAKLDMWFKRQADMLDNEMMTKKMNEKRKKELNDIKMKEEEDKKIRANEAFKLWMKKKEEEKKLENRINSNSNKKIKRNNSAFFRKGQVVIGPYSNAKDLKDMQRRIDEYYRNEYYESDVKENIDDSLQELSSIKKETPAQEPEPEYD